MTSNFIGKKMTKFVYIAFEGEVPISVAETETEAKSLLGGFIGEIYNNLIYNQK